MAETATLLVVDDNSTNLQLLHGFLSSSGYHVLIAEDGESGVRQAAEALPDLVLMDVLLPGMNGFDACRAIHAQATTAHVPVIFLTALAQTDDKVEGFRAGGVDYITKPLQFEEVIARIRVHLAIVRSRRELEQRNLRRERMLEIIAHDLKSPAASFVSALRELASVDRTDPLFDEVLQLLGERADRLNRLIDSLIGWGIARIRVEPNECYPLAEIVRQSVEHVAADARSKSITIEQAVPNGIQVSGNETTLSVVLSNLVVNAVKFTPSGGTVGVRASAADGEVRVEVWDTGVGLDDEDVQAIFTAERRIRRSGTAGEVGSGLGLFLSRDLVDWLGGTLTVDSEPGRGSTFTITLPEPRVNPN